MNAWQWWWCFLLILQLGNAEDLSVHDEKDEKEKNAAESKDEHHKNRERRNSEWFDEDFLNDEDGNAEQFYPLSQIAKRKPIFSSWGGKRLSDFLYYKRKPAFSSWGGKRGPAFSSWGGKRSEGSNLNKQNQKIRNLTNDSSDYENISLNGDTSKYKQKFNFPAEHELYQMLQSINKDKLLTEDKESLQQIYNTHEEQPFPTQDFENNDEENLNLLISQNRKNNNDQQFHDEVIKSIPNQFKIDKFMHYENDQTEDEDPHNEDLEDYNYANDITADLNFEDGALTLSNLYDKRSSPPFNKLSIKRMPAFHSWGGKRAPAFNSWGGKRTPAFNSWGGKRAPKFNSWGGKRRQAFNSWGGKRIPAFHSWGGKRAPSFNSWGDKRAPAFNSWGGKRVPAFNSWGGKREIDSDEYDEINSEPQITQRRKRSITYNEQKDKKNIQLENLNEQQAPELKSRDNTRTEVLDSWGINKEPLLQTDYETTTSDSNTWEDREIPVLNSRNEKQTLAFNSLGGKRALAFNSWGGKRAPAFNSWGGKRAPAFNSWGGKRAQAFNSWGGKRAQAFNSWGGKRAPAFNSWGGKRAPAFNSWGGKRAQAFNSWGGKRAPAFNSWGGKRAPTFNSWGGKRAPAFNSWGGKRAPAFNSWGGKRSPAFNSWGGKRMPAFNSWGGKRNLDDLNREQDALYSFTGKRLPAFHSWGGKRSDVLKSNILDINGEDNISDINNSLYSNNNNEENFSLSSAIPKIENNISLKNIEGQLKKFEKEFPFFLKHNSFQQNEEKLNNKIKSGELSQSQPKNDQISISKRAGERKRNPAFFSWGGKRSDALKHLLFLHDDDSNAVNNDKITLQNNEEQLNNEENNLVNENHNVNKRNAELNKEFPHLPHLVKSDYSRKLKPVFSKWHGKGREQSFENQNTVTIESPQPSPRKKRNIANNAAPLMALVSENNNLDNIISSDIDSISAENIFHELPTGTMMCCMKRVQYGDRNLFMQMLLRTKSFRDLSWPTIRPIRRGSDFYSWGGKRSSL